MFTLTLFQPGLVWSLTNMNYYSTVIEPATAYVKATLAWAVTCFVACLFLMAFVCYAVISNLKYLIGTEEDSWPSHIKYYRNLFEDFECKGRLQLLFVPFSMVRSIIYALTIVFLTSFPLAQIIIIWTVSGLFILYFVVKQPLQDKWNRRLTLVVEVFGFGCMCIGFVIAIFENTAEIGSSTRDEIGFAFIAFTIISTLAGGVLALIQIMELVIAIYKYIREKCRRRRQVKPILLSDTSSPAPSIQKTSTRKSAYFNSPERERDNACFISSKPPENFERMKSSLKYFGTISPEVISRTPQGLLALEHIEKWCQERSDAALDSIPQEKLHNSVFESQRKQVERVKISLNIEK